MRPLATCYCEVVDDMKFTPENFGDVNFSGEYVIPVPLDDVKLTPENFGDSGFIDVKLTPADFADVKPKVVYLTGVDRTGAKVGDVKPVRDELPVEYFVVGVLYVVEVVVVAVDDPGIKLITIASLGSEVVAAALFVWAFFLIELSVTEPSDG
jgi:hypothetical protein